jgi:hypothetical protein
MIVSSHCAEVEAETYFVLKQTHQRYLVVTRKNNSPTLGMNTN